MRDYFASEGFSICTGPSALEGSRKYQDIRHHAQLSNAANVLFMSKDMYRDNRQLVELFAEKASRDWSNIQIISMDEDWLLIKSDSLELLKSISFIPLRHDKPLDVAAIGIAKRIQASIESKSERISHFDQQSFVDLLRGLFGSCKVIASENIAKASIVFTLCECRHPSGEFERYLAVFPKSSLEATSLYLQENLPGEMAKASRAYVVRSDPRQELSVLQKENMKKLFAGTPLRFETMVAETDLKTGASELLSDGEILISQDWKSLNNPFLNATTTDGLISFFDKGRSIYRNNSIVLLTGPGGAGKTHFVRYLHDHLRAQSRGVFFLTAHSVRVSEPDLSISSLFDIYKLSVRDDVGSSVISRELFDLNFCISDPVIIVDGLEEIITMLGDRFRVQDFFNDCRTKAEQLANGKIIITTREQSWPSEIDSYADQFELRLFDKEKVQQYFAAFFINDTARASLAFKIFQSMNDGEIEAPPLICKLIATELENDTPISDYQSKLDQGEFASVDGLNGIIDGFITREKKLGVTWQLEETNLALGKLAVQTVGGPVDFNLARKTIGSAFSNRVPSNLDAAIRNFVLIRYNRETNSITFRYDFVQTLFLARHIIKSIENIDVSILEQEAGIALYSRRLTPGSDVSRKIITTKLSNLPDDFFVILDEIIREISSKKEILNSTAKPYEINQIVSNLLFLRLKCDPSITTIDDNTRVLKSIFASGDSKDDLSSIAMMRFDQGDDSLLKFDLKGCKLSNCWFEDTALDEMLIVDDLTTFVNCDFVRALGNRPSSKASIWTANFEENCRLGPKFESNLHINAASIEATTERKLEELARFFSLFAMPNGHSFSRRWKKASLFGSFNSSLGYRAEQLARELKKRGLLEAIKGHGDNKVQLTKKGQQIARDFILDSVVNSDLKDLLKLLV